LATAAVVTAVVAWWSPWDSLAPVDPRAPRPPATTPDGEVVQDPLSALPEVWSLALSGSSSLSPDALAAALSVKETSDLPAREFDKAGEVAQAVLLARASGQGREVFPEFFLPGASELSQTAPPAFCQDVRVRAVNAQSVPATDGRFARALVLWSGACPAGSVLTSTVVFLERTEDSYQPVWSVAGVVRPDGMAPGVPQGWELSRFSSCGSKDNRRFQARAELVAVFEDMCKDAAKDKVSLEVTSALRSASEQELLLAEAADRLGSRLDARRWVAESDGVSCASRHCAGEAVDVEDTASVKRWLFATVGCLSAPQGGDPVFTPASKCQSGQTPVQRLERYGFTAPLPGQPWHLELGLPLPLLASDVAGSCDPPRSQSVPQLVVSVFRCQLESAGVDRATADQAAGEAVVVSRCSSNWNAGYVAFAGRFRDTPNPQTGELSDETGVFALSGAAADRWVPGGRDAASDATANITGAASVWLAEHAAGRPGFGPFPCAQGRVPSSGGPELPRWASSIAVRQ
jgi:hypothetical protein